MKPLGRNRWFRDDDAYIFWKRGFPGEKRYPAGTSTSTNVRLTEAEIHAVSMACRTARQIGPRPFPRHRPGRGLSRRPDPR